MTGATVWRGVALVALSIACGWLAEPARAGSPERHPGTTGTTTAAGPELGTTGAAAESGEAAVTRQGGRYDPVRDYPLFGVATHFMAQVYLAPSDRAQVYGYARRGAGLRLKAGAAGPGCDTEWHAVFGGGYVCAGRGVSLVPGPGYVPDAASAPDGPPVKAPAAPVLYEALPYPYMKLNLKDAAMYLREPTADEELAVAAVVALARKLGLEPTPAIKMPPPPKKPAVQPKAAARVTGKVDPRNPRALLAAKGARGPAKPPARVVAPKPPPKPASVTREPQRPASRLKALPDFVRMLLQPGFYVSLDDDAPLTELSFARTIRGDFLRLPTQDRVRGSTLQGSVLPSQPLTSFALVVQPHTLSYRRDVMSGELIAAEPLRQLETLVLNDEVIVRRGKRFRVALDGRIAPEAGLRYLPAIERPKLVPSQARWIGVNLEHQTLVAYEGARPVYATLVATGRSGYETPTGVFRIQSKHVSTTMDGEALGDDEAYSIEDVPWVMYFSGSIALHGAFWHEKFGRPRSHGCVNLAPLDARWLFEWAGPRLPAGFHGVLSNTERAGTFVVIVP